MAIMGINEEEYFASGHRACAGCGEALALRHILKAAGKNTIVAQATGCMEVVSSPYPETSWEIPWVHCAFENAAAVASGIRAALNMKGDKTTNVIAIGGDGASFDIGFGALSGALERGHKFLYVVTDNEAYMNCLALDSLIMTNDGLKKITEINVGDEVYAFSQSTNELVLKKCSGVFDNGEKRVFEINTSSNTIKATGNHPFLVHQRNGKTEKNKFVWKIVEELKVGDEAVSLKKGIKGNSYDFPKTNESKKGALSKYASQNKQRSYLFESEHFETKKIISIKKLGVEPTLDLRVEGEHNFVANGMVVHNTGIQRSGATFPYAATTTSPAGKKIHGKQQPKKPLPFIVAAHGIEYVATANVSNLIDLKNKVEKALKVGGPSFLHVLVPCIPGWKIDTSATIRVAQKAIDTWAAPVYEIEKGVLKLTQKPEAKPIEEYLMMQGRFKHVTPDINKKIQEYVDKRKKFLLENDGKKIFDTLF